MPPLARTPTADWATALCDSDCARRTHTAAGGLSRLSGTHRDHALSHFIEPPQQMPWPAPAQCSVSCHVRMRPCQESPCHGPGQRAPTSMSPPGPGVSRRMPRIGNSGGSPGRSQSCLVHRVADAVPPRSIGGRMCTATAACMSTWRGSGVSAQQSAIARAFPCSLRAASESVLTLHSVLVRLCTCTEGGSQVHEVCVAVYVLDTGPSSTTIRLGRSMPRVIARGATGITVR